MGWQLVQGMRPLPLLQWQAFRSVSLDLYGSAAWQLGGNFMRQTAMVGLTWTPD